VGDGVAVTAPFGVAADVAVAVGPLAACAVSGVTRLSDPSGGAEVQPNSTTANIIIPMIDLGNTRFIKRRIDILSFGTACTHRTTPCDANERRQGIVRALTGQEEASCLVE
jgi:hypothetical protein